MKQPISLDDCVLFLAVAQAGGLAGAARASGVSVPTLSRRMQAFENRLGRHLFQRGSHGYALTAAGVALRSELDGLQSFATRLDGFARGAQKARVRITAGLWTSQFLAQHIGRIWSGPLPWVPEFLPSNTTLDIARRAADIGIRNSRPEQAWLAGTKTSVVTYAPFGAHDQACGWVAMPESPQQTKSQAWVRDRHAGDIVTTASDPRVALELVQGGLGQMVLPLFAGHAAGLTQTGPVIDEITHDEWLVAHHEARADPPIRSALDRLTALLRDRALRPNR